MLMMIFICFYHVCYSRGERVTRLGKCQCQMKSLGSTRSPDCLGSPIALLVQSDLVLVRFRSALSWKFAFPRDRQERRLYFFFIQNYVISQVVLTMDYIDSWLLCRKSPRSCWCRSGELVTIGSGDWISILARLWDLGIHSNICTYLCKHNININLCKVWLNCWLMILMMDREGARVIRYVRVVKIPLMPFVTAPSCLSSWQCA